MRVNYLISSQVNRHEQLPQSTDFLITLHESQGGAFELSLPQYDIDELLWGISSLQIALRESDVELAQIVVFKFKLHTVLLFNGHQPPKCTFITLLTF